MLTLINANRMNPPIAPLALDYVGAVARAAGVSVELVDLGLASEPDELLRSALSRSSPALVGITFRNLDDGFWPSATTFLPELRRLLARVAELTDAPIVVGGVGFSIAAMLLMQTGSIALGVQGDGEGAALSLYRAVTQKRSLDEVPGLLWREGGHSSPRVRRNPPNWPRSIVVPPARDLVDNAEYFRRGGQAGLETKRGCPRRCIYCADPVAKGPHVRARDPKEVACEVAALVRQGIDVLHICDGEFNVPRSHAAAVCEEIVRRGLGERFRWYAYVAVRPFDAELARLMRRAGCVGLNFTGDSANDQMLAAYRQPHRQAHLASAVEACQQEGIACMVDLLVGGPGETPESVRETIDFMRRLAPDCVGVGLGMRIYPDTPVARILRTAGPLESDPGLRRHYAGPVDLLKPTFYIAPSLGEVPGRWIRELIGDDPRFFPPLVEVGNSADDHNYNNNQHLVDAIGRGARGAYWDILRQVATIDPLATKNP